MFIKLSEGNTGSLSVICKLKKEDREELLKKLFKNGIVGPMIWVAYKDICNSDIEKFKEKILDNSLIKELENTVDWKDFKNTEKAKKFINSFNNLDPT